MSQFHEYLLREHRSDVVQLSTTRSSDDEHRSIVVHFNMLCEFNNIFSQLLLSCPDRALSVLNEGLYAALHAVSSTTNGDGKPHNQRFLHVRLTALPVIPEVHKNTIPRSVDVGKFIALRATVSRVGPVQVLSGQQTFQCSNCRRTSTVVADLSDNYQLKPPRNCPGRGEGCKSFQFKPINSALFYAKNYQEIRVHERFRCLAVGTMPRSIRVCLEDDLLECVKPGDDVVINGTVVRCWPGPREGSECQISLWIKANFVENLSELKTAGQGLNRLPTERLTEFAALRSRTLDNASLSKVLEFRNNLVESVCHDVCGMFPIKLSMALLLVGSPEWNYQSGE